MPDQRDISLAPPGAGLPAYENVALRYVLFPFYTRVLLTWRKATVRFRHEGDRILFLTKQLNESQRIKPVLIKRLPGIEDSSRNWSVAMTVAHLMIVGARVQHIIERLSRGETVEEPVDIAAFKPDARASTEMLASFPQFMDAYILTVNRINPPSLPDARHAHPWFGPLNTYEWHCLAAIHQGVHREQIERIIAGL